jgi:hypothetical protein
MLEKFGIRVILELVLFVLVGVIGIGECGDVR